MFLDTELLFFGKSLRQRSLLGVVSVDADALVPIAVLFRNDS